jgi:hypothetical protein
VSLLHTTSSSFIPYHSTGPFCVHCSKEHLSLLILFNSYWLPVKAGTKHNPNINVLTQLSSSSDDSTARSFHYGAECNLISYEADQEHRTLRSSKVYKFGGGSCGENRCAGKPLSTRSVGSIRRPGTAHTHTHPAKETQRGAQVCKRKRSKVTMIVETSTTIQPPAIQQVAWLLRSRIYTPTKRSWFFISDATKNFCT